jgi:hypothetical protein
MTHPTAAGNAAGTDAGVSGYFQVDQLILLAPALLLAQVLLILLLVLLLIVVLLLALLALDQV